jgi:hypothetical protein
MSTMGDKLDTISKRMDALEVQIPAWTTKKGVLLGEEDEMGFPVPTAANLGIIPEFIVVQRFDDQTPGKVFEMDPPAGTTVFRGSRVSITVGYGDEE